jgi:hypothetical protein
MPVQMTPGRRAALAVSVPFAVALIGWTSYNFVALAATATMRIATPVPIRDGALTADVSGSEIVLRQAAAGSAELTGTARYSLFRPVFTQTRTATGVDLSYRCRGLTGNCDLSATLKVPLRTAVTLSTDGGNVSVPGFTGDLTVLSAGGDVNASTLTGTVRLSTDGGNIEAGSLSGSLDLRTGGGDLMANTVTGSEAFQAETDGGNVSMQAVADPGADINTSGGDVTLTFVKVPRDLQITSDGGNIFVVLPAASTPYGIQANADGGNVGIGRSITVRGDAANKLILDSGGGDITVTQAG